MGTTTTFTGTLGWRSLTLQYADPSTGTIQSLAFQPGSEADYNNVVARLRQRTAASAAATQAAQATVTAQGALDQAVREANTRLSNDLSVTSADVQSLASGQSR